MFDHISIGVRDLPAARRFYDAVLPTLGFTTRRGDDKEFSYGGLILMATEHPVPADARSGLHFCFEAPTRAAVDAFHAAALRNGGSDNGAPGLRPDYGADYYAAFALDCDGYRIEAYCCRPE